MSRAKPGEYTLELDQLGAFDVVSLKDDKVESRVLAELKADLIRQGKFLEIRAGEICWASIAAFIMLVESTALISESHRDETDSLH